MGMIELGLGFGAIAIVPLGAAVKKSYANEKRLTILETNYENVEQKLTQMDSKLDRLIERFLPHG